MSRAAVEAADFERRYLADPDPWGYESSAYERTKYRHTLAVLPEGPVGEALELGCSNGAFTALLAPRCESLLAIDFSAAAVRLARSRTAEQPNVVVEERDLRAGLPAGSFDLVICSELLYYWTREQVAAFCVAVARALRPGGSLIAVHWRGVDPLAPLDGEGVHRLLGEHLAGRLVRTYSERQPGYLLDRWERASLV